MRWHATLLPVTLSLLIACTEPTSSAAAAAAAPPDVISDGSTDGNPHFFFLPPMVANPHAGGPNDATRSPVVVICEFDGSICVTTLATFTTDLSTTTTTQPGNSETVRVSASHYIVNWHTKGFDLDPALTYRICVKVDDVQLGFADVDVIASGGEKKGVADGFVAVHNGRTLPIKFRIEAGALEEPGTSLCGDSPE